MQNDNLKAETKSKLTASEMGRLGGLKGGKSRSKKKLAAIARNAKLGGRPRKAKPTL